MARRKAFTIVELLVVIAIIVALLAILLPSMSRAIELSHRAICASNLHQVHVGFVSYASDLFGVIPGGTHVQPHAWKPQLADTLRHKYLGGSLDVLRCPSRDAPLDEARYLLGMSDDDSRLTHYFLTRTKYLNPKLPPTYWTADLDGDGQMDNFQVERLSDPGTMVLLGDWTWEGYLEYFMNNIFPESIPPHPSGIASPGGGVYPAGSNTVRLDGSAGWTQFMQMRARYSYWSPIVNHNRVLWW